MKPNPPLLAVSTFLAVGVISAPCAGQGLESAGRDAQRFADCLNESDAACIDSLRYIYVGECADFGEFISLNQVRSMFDSPGQFGDFDYGYFHIEVDEPQPLEVGGNQLYAMVPYELTTHLSFWFVQRGFLIGIHNDAAGLWQFIDDRSATAVGMERIIPGFAGQELPQTGLHTYSAPAATRSKYLTTVRGGFAPGHADDEASYELSLEIERRIRKEIPLLIVYENAADPSQRHVAQSVLAPGQTMLRLTSSLMTGFQSGHSYEVGVFGLDKEGEVEFEHRQMLMYRPEREFEFVPVPGIAGPSLQAERFNESENRYRLVSFYSALVDEAPFLESGRASAVPISQPPGIRRSIPVIGTCDSPFEGIYGPPASRN